MVPAPARIPPLRQMRFVLSMLVLIDSRRSHLFQPKWNLICSDVFRMPLEKYRSKRDFKITAEPQGSLKKVRGSSPGLAFVVQKHQASHLHYDFRLEWNGVLLSWAVPKGPSLDPSVKRLAMAVEDHPIEYGGFEGIIPEGQYGGGTVMLWDRGTWQPEDPDVERNLQRGELKFELRGSKLKGSWVLVRTKTAGSSHRAAWLLIKHKDRFASSSDIVASKPRSALSKRLMAQIAATAGGNVAKAAQSDPVSVPAQAHK
jgi:bifunctional non-homologous end joining protein LigD